MATISRYTGYVTLLDVLGFRELVGRDDHRKYMDTVAELIGEPEEGRLLQYVLFSDSVIINTQTDDDESLWTLLRACSRLLAALLEKQIPLRGAVAFGEFDRSLGTERGVIVAGRPIIDAYHYEQQQDWIGIMLCPSVLRRIADLPAKCCFPNPTGKTSTDYLGQLRWPLVLSKWGGIPFRTNSPMSDHTAQEGFAVVPVAKKVGSVAEVRSSIRRTLQALERMKIVSPDPASQGKYRRTGTFLEYVLQSWPNRPGR